MDRPGLGHDTAELACDTDGEGLQHDRDIGRDTADREQGRVVARARVAWLAEGRDTKIVSWLRGGRPWVARQR